MKLSKKLVKRLLPGEYEEELNNVQRLKKEDLGLSYNQVKIQLVPVNPEKLIPGDIITFSYSGDSFGTRQALVVATSKHSSGKFLSSRGNRLLCCFDLKSSVSSLFTIFNNLFKDRENSNYQKLPNTLKSVLNTSNFKTYNLVKMDSAYELEVVEVRV
jgi:hypothetical protein